MSFGIAVYKEHAKQIDMLIQKADKALYRAKETGRNKVELF
jgi:diguanylate cyclase (GGDEF)-like protein